MFIFLGGSRVLTYWPVVIQQLFGCTALCCRPSVSVRKDDAVGGFAVVCVAYCLCIVYGCVLSLM